MAINKPEPNNIANKNSLEYKYTTCFGRNCNNQGKFNLKIILINRRGWFCDSCAKDLISLKLVEETD